MYASLLKSGGLSYASVHKVHVVMNRLLNDGGGTRDAQRDASDDGTRPDDRSRGGSGDAGVDASRPSTFRASIEGNRNQALADFWP